MPIFKLAKWLDTSSQWWVLPYGFATVSDATAFLAQLRQANPGHAFRLV